MRVSGQPYLHITCGRVHRVLVACKYVSHDYVYLVAQQSQVFACAYRVDELSNTTCMLRREWYCFCPFREIVGERNNEPVTPWCLGQWSNQIHSQLAKSLRFNRDWMYPTSSFLELFVTTLATITRFHLVMWYVNIIT